MHPTCCLKCTDQCKVAFCNHLQDNPLGRLFIMSLYNALLKLPTLAGVYWVTKGLGFFFLKNKTSVWVLSFFSWRDASELGEEENIHTQISSKILVPCY